MSAGTDDWLARALGYPYVAPEGSYTLRGGVPETFDPTDRDGRTPVLAYGSNRAPAQLRRKFPAADDIIPVQRVWLADHDVVYSAHITAYGAVPAALRAAPGCRVAVAVTWLDATQLTVMHDSETAAANYSYAEVTDLRLTLDDGSPLAVVGTYIGTRGHLAQQGEALALVAIAAEGRTLPAAEQQDAIALVRDLVAPDMPLRDFVQTAVDDRALRRRHIGALQAHAVAAKLGTQGDGG